MEELKNYINFEAIKKMTFKEAEKVLKGHPIVEKHGGAEKVYNLIVPPKKKVTEE